MIDNGGTGVPARLPAGGGIGVVDFFYWGEKPTRIDAVHLKISAAQSGATGMRIWLALAGAGVLLARANDGTPRR